LKNDAAYSQPGGKAMRQCEYCGSELRARARFCGHCGKKVGSETEATTNVDDAPIVDIPASQLAATTVFTELQDATPENDVEEEELLPQLVLENDVEEEQTAHLALETDVEEEQTDNPESSSLAPDDLYVEPEIPANQFLDEQTQLDQMRSEKLAVLSPSVSIPRVKTRSRFVPKMLIILLTVLIIAAGCMAALIGLFRWHLPGTSGAANAISSSSVSEIVNTAGPLLNASVCASSSTHATPGTGDGTGLTLSTASGCSSFNNATATSLCLIAPYNPGTFHRYILNVSNVAVDNKAYHLVLSITEYSGPTNYNHGDHIMVGIGEGSTGGNFSWLYRSGNVTINSDEQSGTMDVILESANGGNTIHVVGGWMCGHLIKIK